MHDFIYRKESESKNTYQDAAPGNAGESFSPGPVKRRKPSRYEQITGVPTPEELVTQRIQKMIRGEEKLGEISSAGERTTTISKSIQRRSDGRTGTDNISKSGTNPPSTSRATHTASDLTSVPKETESKIRSMRGAGGQPLEPATRAFMESQIGHDFSDVRVHTGPVAESTANELNAKAYTLGNDIAFNAGQYKPESQEGKKLIAHELTHTVQQKGEDGSLAAKRIQRKPDGRRDLKYISLPGYKYYRDLDIPVIGFKKDYTAEEKQKKILWFIWEKMSSRVFLKVTNDADRLIRYSTIFPEKPRMKIENRGGVSYGILSNSSLGQFAVVFRQYGRFAIGLNTRATGRQRSGAFSFRNIEMHGMVEYYVNRDDALKVTEAYPVGENFGPFRDPELATHLVMALAQFAGFTLTSKVHKYARRGFTPALVYNLTRGDARWSYMAKIYGQGYRDFQNAGGSSKQHFFYLMEALLEQMSNGNRLARGNILQIGRGRSKSDTIGIRDRRTHTLFYDGDGLPIITSRAVKRFADPDFRGVRRRDRSFYGPREYKYGAPLGSSSIVRDDRELRRMAIQGARNFSKFRDEIETEVKKGLGREAFTTFGVFLGFFIAFLAFHILARRLMMSGNPWMALTGLALLGILKAANYYFMIYFAVDIYESLLTAGYHLSRLRRGPDGKLGELSRKHLSIAADQLRSIITALAAFAGIIGGVRFARMLLAAQKRKGWYRLEKKDGQTRLQKDSGKSKKPRELDKIVEAEKLEKQRRDKRRKKELAEEKKRIEEEAKLPEARRNARRRVRERFQEITIEEFKNNKHIQQEVFELARIWRAEQTSFIFNLLKNLRIRGKWKTILKRESFTEFRDGIIEKAGRKDYARIGRMDDMVRGRIDLPTWKDVIKVRDAMIKHPTYFDRSPPKRPIGSSGEFGYPRWHLILKHKSGITHEWQIGTRAVSRVYEKPGINIGKLKLKKGMKNDLHDIEYDIMAPLQKKHPGLAAKLGIPAFRKKVDVLSGKAGRLGDEIPQKTLDKEISKLHAEAGKIVRELYRLKGQAFIEQFFH